MNFGLVDYLKQTMSGFIEELHGYSLTPATGHLFQVREDGSQGYPSSLLVQSDDFEMLILKFVFIYAHQGKTLLNNCIHLNSALVSIVRFWSSPWFIFILIHSLYKALIMIT